MKKEINFKGLTHKERKILREKYPEEYKAYLSKVRSSIGKIGGVAKGGGNYIRGIK